jgi:alcohol dehydrogenase, propanol-preferring
MAGATITGATMAAAVLHEPGGPLSIEHVPVPKPGRGEVLIRVRACGLGLTLVWNRNGRRGAPLPRILGHEIAGDIVQVGSGVSGVSAGDRVAVYYYLICGACRWCLAGHEGLCERRAGVVGRDVNGGLAEFVCLPAANVVAIPDGVDYVDAAVTADAGATSLHVLADRAKLQAGETVLVIGAGGGVGVQMVQTACLLGGAVVGVDITPDKLALARTAGAHEALDGRLPDLAQALRSANGGHGYDVVVEMVGRPETLRTSAACLGTRGRLVLVGSYDPEAALAVRHDTLRGEGSVLGSQYCTRDEIRAALRLVADGKIRPVVTQRCSLDKADEVLLAIERMEVAGRACVVFA